MSRLSSAIARDCKRKLARIIWHVRCRTAEPMSLAPTPGKLQEAIHTCVSRCQLHDRPLFCIAESIEKLRCDPTWKEYEITQVETGIRRILARLINADD